MMLWGSQPIQALVLCDLHSALDKSMSFPNLQRDVHIRVGK